MSSRRDPRSARTTAAIEAAVRALLTTRELDDVAVTEVAARAGISRPSFYTHYSTVGDVVVAMAVRDVSTLIRTRDPVDPGMSLTDAMRHASGDAFRLIAEERLLFRRAFESSASSAVRRALSALATARLEEIISSRQLGAPPADIPLAVAHAVGGFVSLLEHWACFEDESIDADRWMTALEQSTPRWWDSAR